MLLCVAPLPFVGHPDNINTFVVLSIVGYRFQRHRRCFRILYFGDQSVRKFGHVLILNHWPEAYHLVAWSVVWLCNDYSSTLTIDWKYRNEGIQKTQDEGQVIQSFTVAIFGYSDFNGTECWPAPKGMKRSVWNGRVKLGHCINKLQAFKTQNAAISNKTQPGNWLCCHAPASSLTSKKRTNYLTDLC